MWKAFSSWEPPQKGKKKGMQDSDEEVSVICTRGRTETNIYISKGKKGISYLTSVLSVGTHGVSSWALQLPAYVRRTSAVLSNGRKRFVIPCHTSTNLGTHLTK